LTYNTFASPLGSANSQFRPSYFNDLKAKVPNRASWLGTSLFSALTAHLGRAAVREPLLAVLVVAVLTLRVLEGQNSISRIRSTRGGRFGSARNQKFALTKNV